MIKKFDVANYNIFTEGNNREFMIKYVKIKNYNFRLVIMYLCIDLLDLHDYVSFTSVFGVHIPNFFTISKKTLLFPHHLEVDSLVRFF